MILAIDQGTTGTTCIVFDERAEPIGRAYREFTQHFPASRLGRARSARDLGGDALPSPPRRCRTPASVPASSTRSASPTSARPSACGTPTAASRCTTRSSGRTGAPPIAARSCAAQGHEPLVRAAHRARARPLLLGHQDRSGCSSTSTACASAPRAGAPCSARRLVADLQAHRRAPDRRLERLAHAALRHRRRPLGPRAARAVRRPRASAATRTAERRALR